MRECPASRITRLALAIVVTIGLQLCAVYVPFLQRFFVTTALSAGQLGVTALVPALVFGAVELEKVFIRRRGV